MNAPSLRNDTRGAALVLGIVMGALLVGALWHIASIGDAAIWRERAQDAADAAAFESAVWHARGMNALAAINIVMSLVLAVLVVWRIALIVVSVALVVSGIFCVLSLGAECPVTVALLQVEQQMLQNDNRVATTVVRILGAARAIETTVASVTPLLALQQSSANTRAAYAVDDASSLSASMIPSINVAGAKNFVACLSTGKPAPGKEKAPAPAEGAEEVSKGSKAVGAVRDFIGENLSHPRLGEGVSLPVEEDDYSTLCTKAGEYFLNQYAGLFERMGAPGPLVEAIDKVKGMMGKVIGKFPSMFCHPWGDGIPPELSELLDKQAKESCKETVDQYAKTQKRTWVRDENGELEEGYRNPKETQTKGRSRLQKECTKERSDEAKKETAKAIKETAKSMTDCAKPAKVWEYAMNGNVFMRSFAQVRAAAPLAQRDARGIAVAGGVDARAQVPSMSPVLAHAEVYLDCEGDWMDCRDDALWQLRWRARLRRVQPLRTLAATAVQPALASWLEGALGALESNLKLIKDTPQYKDMKGDALDDFYRTSTFRRAGTLVFGNPALNPTVH